MRLAVISDTHFGCHEAALVQKKDDKWEIGPYYDTFRKNVGQGLDYLVMLGDILDFSVAKYEVAYDAAKVFFQRLKDDGVLDNKEGRVVYLAGNHDADMWHIVQHQRHIVNKMLNGKTPTPYKHSVACVIDDRGGVERSLLSNTTPKTVSADGQLKYGGMFFDHITAPETIFYFAYPNLYLATDQATILMTHGQYFDAYWSLLSEILLKIVGGEVLNVGNTVGILDIEELMQLNYPLNQLACTGIGQSEAVRVLVEKVQKEFNKGDLRNIDKYIDKLVDYADGLFDKWYLELFTDACLKGSGKAAKNMLRDASKQEQARDNAEYCRALSKNPRFACFTAAVREEIGLINGRENTHLTVPGHIIFGHTHVPVGWQENCARLDSTPGDIPVRTQVHNTGGWVYKTDDKGKRVFCGAEIFIYETDTGIRSVRIN